MGQMFVVDLETFCWCMQQRPTGKVQWVHQSRAEEHSLVWPYAACLLQHVQSCCGWARVERTGFVN